MAVDINQVAEDMYNMVVEVTGVKKLKPGDLLKAVVKKYESEGLTKKEAKEAIRILIDGERLIYTYVNGSFVELPHEDGAAFAANEAAKK
jgi:pyruvoyl-dependent arginine decarboxylase (PvlArgDC)